jgi:hypothetical protein
MLILFCVRGCGRNGARHSLRPDLQKAAVFWQTSRGSRGEIAKLCLKLFGCLKIESVAMHLTLGRDERALERG